MFRAAALSVLLLWAAGAAAQALFGVSATAASGSSQVILEVGGRDLLTVPITYSLAAFDPVADVMYLIASGSPRRLYVADLRLGTLTLSSDADGATFAFDTLTRRLFVSRGGTISVAGGSTVMMLPRDYSLLAIDGARQRAFITERGDTSTQMLYAANLDAGTVGPALAPIGVSDKVIVDTDGTAVVFHAGPNFSVGSVERIDPVTGKRQPLDQEFQRLSARLAQPAVDSIRRVAYLTSWWDVGSCRVLELDLVSGAIREAGFVRGDTVDLAFGTPLASRRSRAVRH
jgi:hypothetical protein